MFSVSSSFIGDFKLGDNICYNLEVIGALYALRVSANAEQAAALRKPIIILNVSIIDAVLHDFFGKIRLLTVEGVPNVPAVAVALWRNMTIDKLEVYITQARKRDLFGEPLAFYDQLHDLRKLRNRVHIQNERRHFEPDDQVAFSEVRLVQSEQAVEKVLVKMSQNHPRNQQYVNDLTVPWNRHFPQAAVN